MKNRISTIYTLSYIIILLLVVLFSFSCSEKKFSKNTVIAIQPFGTFNIEEIRLVKQNIELHYGFRTVVLPHSPLIKAAFTNMKSPRYRADKLIKYLKDHKPDSVDYILGLTSSDISTTKYKDGKVKSPAWKYQDWGICGLGYRPGPSCIVSTFRLEHSDKTVFHERLKKITTHEFGHNLGLTHCDHHEDCVMQDAAESVSTIDRAKNILCDHCKNLIK